ncbi:MarR family transcriptional regulator [Sphingomonas koreensis]|uniref:MarR family transcriptional regulator n=1 Tax=Sphingomonas koreensis TaxID=93064 RepID=A0A1L6JB75_9SPHN|nr:MarR family transcriptional regulator [Sphingomonas koreensis]APR53126.1 hypothetical protein BRX40_12425 [Sphingomonas koreensis]
MSGDLAARTGEQPDPKALGRIASRLSELAAECAALGLDGTSPGSPVLVPLGQRNPQRASDLAQRVHAYLVARRARVTVLKGDWFADPAWDLLLDLFAARHLGRRVSISSACIAANVPPTTALRWIDKLVEDGVLLRENDPLDGRRSYLGLAPEVAARLEQWVERYLQRPVRLGHLPAC